MRETKEEKPKRYKVEAAMLIVLGLIECVGFVVGVWALIQIFIRGAYFCY